MGYARTLAIALFNGGARRWCAIAIIDLLTLPQWGLGNFFCPWWAALELNQETLRCRILSPYYNSLLVALPRHNIQIGPVRLPISPTAHIFRILKVCWPSPYTLFNLHLYSTNEETRSELRGATSNFRPQSKTYAAHPLERVRHYSHAGLIACNFHPPFRNCYLITNQSSIKH